MILPFQIFNITPAHLKPQVLAKPFWRIKHKKIDRFNLDLSKITFPFQSLINATRKIDANLGPALLKKGR